jgi:sortase A
VDAWIFQRRESRELDRLLRARAVSESAPRLAPKNAPAVAADGLIGRVEIPRLLLSAVVIEGVDKTTLRRAVGHIPGTALPGEPGNVGLAGHRDTFFRPLKDLKLKDRIRFSTLGGNFNYEVESLRIVEPDNVGVLASSGENVLTLVTCYPFHYVGPAPQRWIVRARQVVR